MNWQKANQALGNIERLLQVFETSKNLSSIERDLLLRRIQDLYEIILENENVDTKTTTPPITTPKPVVQKPPVIETPKVEEKIAFSKPKVELPKVEVSEEKVIIETPKPKVELPKVEIREEKPIIEKPRVELPKVEIPKIKISKPKPEPEPKPEPKVEVPKPPVTRPKSPVIEERTYEKPVVTKKFDEEETEIIEELFEFKSASDLSEKLSTSPIQDLTKSMSINERFITISELFKGNKSKYDEAIHELNNFYSFEQAKAYILNHLIEEYNWTKKKKIKSAKAFIKKVRRRYL
ncbi:MAG: hypothetical protein AB8G11_02105 [Saprospiraceae bacterium]